MGIFSKKFNEYKITIFSMLASFVFIYCQNIQSITKQFSIYEKN